ncbi:hypothetical protein TrLO_g2038 [Triparma laevis f. longispina]|uniref:Uncharacterized protein n=1 Tax=Triparma laevis f. longispina TaxID=1714387 RepID=A0A9W7FBS4_9STRA|nr:hypothetical protein TrLO_g2038 [Triparma laevis f. longispina]
MGFSIHLSPGFIPVPFIGLTAWHVALPFLLLYVLMLVWAVRGRALFLCCGCLVLVAPSTLPFERLLGNELEALSGSVFEFWRRRACDLDFVKTLDERRASSRWKKLYENGPFAVPGVLNRSELKLISEKVDALQSSWVYNLEAYPLPEFRLGGNLRTIEQPSAGAKLRAGTRDNMINAFHNEDIKIFEKMAGAFEDVIDLERGAVRWQEVSDLPTPGFQMQYPHAIFGTGVFIKHTDGEGIHPEEAPKGYNCEWDGGETVSAVLPLELPRAGGGLDWWLWDYSKEECRDEGSVLTDVWACIAKHGRQKYVEGDMYFYTGPILHAIASWSINQPADPTTSAPENVKSALHDRRLAAISFYNWCLDEKTKEPVWIMASNPFYISEEALSKLNALDDL